MIPCRIRPIFTWIAAAAVAATAAARPQAPAADSTPAGSDKIVDQVRHNILSQPVGDHTVGHLNLPDEFVSRIAERVIRDSFRDRYRIVVNEAATVASEPATVEDQQRAPLWMWGALSLCVMISVAALLVRRRKPAEARA